MIYSLPNVYTYYSFLILPIDPKNIQRSSHQPHLFPFIQSKHSFFKVVAHLLKEIINRCITPLEAMEVVTQRNRKLFLANKTHQLLEASSSLRISYTIENRMGLRSVLDLSSNRMSRSISKIFFVTPNFPISEDTHS